MTVIKQTFISSEHLNVAQAALKELNDFIAELNDEYIDVEAWSVFHVWLDGRPEKNAPYFSAFRAWQVFHWRPAPGTVPLPIDETSKTIAEAYLRLKSSELEKSYVEVIRSGVAHAPDIYEVSTFNGDFVSAIGTISQKKIIIYQPGLSRMGKSGDYLMAHAIPANEGCHILLGASDFVSRKAKPLVQEFCNLVKLCDSSSPGSFEEIQSDFFNLFHDLKRYSTQNK